MKIGCSSITWRRQAPLAEVLRQIAEVGYEGAPAGYVEGARPEDVAALYRSLGLAPAPGYLGARYHDPAERGAILEQARRQADWSAALGLTELFVAESCFEARFAVAGHETADRADGLSDDGYRAAADALNEVGRICRARGVTACFHNHAGSYVETRDELERILALTDPDLVALGLDTGHLAYGGGDAVEVARAHAPRIRALHLKDVRPDVLAEARRQRWHYRTAEEHGIWAELGEGVVDLARFFEPLRAAGFAGWAIVEVDRTTRESPRRSVEVSYANLREALR